MEALLKQLLEGQKRVETKLDSIETRLDNVETRLDSIETRLDNVETRLDSIETRLDNVETRLDNVETRLNNVETKIDTEFKNSKESDAAILGLIEKTYKKAEQIDSIADDINYLLQRNAKHDNELRELRKAL